MATISITQIQLRRGLAADLPGAPTSLSPVTFPIGLQESELGYTTDEGRLFVGIGQDTPQIGMPNYKRTTFPYQNIEVLTENSPLNAILGDAFADNQLGYITAMTLSETTTFQFNVQVANTQGTVGDFHFDLGSGTGVNAAVTYFLFDSSNNPIRQGRLNILWNTGMGGEPLCNDDALALAGSSTAIQWQAVTVGSGGSLYIALQYINTTSTPISMFFRVDRPDCAALLGS